MMRNGFSVHRHARRLGAMALGLLGLLASLWPLSAGAVPAFARQTGQNCVACHAGGQFPELTPYGRMFKLTGYTIGQSTVPLSVMGLTTLAKVANTSKSDDPGSDFQKNGQLLPLATASIFLAGKITNNLGGFVQVTYDNYASQDSDGNFHGHSQADNMDLRWAEHVVDDQRDLVFGFSLNSNPSVSDPWNTAAAWMQYVPVPSPTSHQFIDGTAPYPSFGSGGNIAGISAYLFWNRSFYAELGTYRSANQALGFMSAGIADADKTFLAGNNNPYWRFAVSREWGPHNLMVGTSGMVAHVYDTGSDTTDPNNISVFRNQGVDAQYQYILDPHTFTAQLAYMRQEQRYSANTLAGAAPPYFLADGVTPVAGVNPSDTTYVLRAKLSYIYQAKYGAAIGYFNRWGSSNTLNQSSGYDNSPGGGLITSNDPNGTGITSTRVTGNLSGNPATRGLTYEVFWMPWQYVRLGAQYTAYSKYNGAGNNYDGFGRNASDNNSLFLYAWYAF
jgi:hypothetical protein